MKVLKMCPHLVQETIFSKTQPLTGDNLALLPDNDFCV